MRTLRITALSQPTLAFPDESVPETILWPVLPEEARSRALVLLAELLARHAGDVTPLRQDDRARGAEESAAGQAGRRR